MATTVGILFPLVLTSGKHTLASESELIQASIKTIITWPIYHRFFNGDFGARTFEVLEEPNDSLLITLIRKFIIDSITTWERRIELLSTQFDRPSSTELVVELTYKIRSLNIEDSFTHTFYTN